MVGGEPVTPSAMQAVVPIGDCTGVLVTPDRLLMAAHCLMPGLGRVIVAGRALRVTGCDAHPAYRPLRVAHDVAVCRLDAPAHVEAIPIDDGPALEIGRAVTLAGYGQAGAFAHTAPALRSVETTIVGADAQSVDVGTADRTACLGDSGGPVLIERDGTLRVAAIIHGPSGAICASPATAARIDAADEWLARALASRSAARATYVLPRLAMGLLVVVVAVLLVFRSSRSSARAMQ